MSSVYQGGVGDTSVPSRRLWSVCRPLKPLSTHSYRFRFFVMVAFSFSLLALCSGLILGYGDAFTTADSSAAGNPKAILADGPLIGTITRPASAPTAVVNQFLGVPFAAPPRRFEPPEYPKPWTRPYNATAYKPSCIQQFSSMYL